MMQRASTLKCAVGTGTSPCLFLLVVLCVLAAADAQKSTKVLMLGNSYTNSNGGLDVMVKGLLQSDKGFGRTVRVDKCAKGGRTLYQHLDDADGTNGATELRRWLVAPSPTDWNWVILQDQKSAPTM